ncbi:DUF5327 family protein [Bacillus sp. FJAT-45350]|uniref:DUF5327 family protein n=1 Tax=Bacillus sp. FJAT-45350 TaxID=2011014 RepID=UPI000BB8112D|nr:DUF5327 family protein [Bacillus sp. FJAT-45350]
MNISAKKVVANMEKKLDVLKGLLDDSSYNQEKIKEQAISIKAYCDLLLDEEVSSKAKLERDYQENNISTPAPAPIGTTSVNQGTTSDRIDVKENLLEF